MKKLILLLILFYVPAVNGQKLVERNQDNVRSISTTPTLMRTDFTDRTPINIVLSCSEVDHSDIWDIRIYFTSATSFSIPQGGKLLLKLNNDEIMELEQSLPESETRDLFGKRSEYGVTYTISSSYSIGEDVLSKICAIGLKKLRIETSGDHIDKDFKSDKITPFFASSYVSIKKALSKPKPELAEGF